MSYCFGSYGPSCRHGKYDRHETRPETGIDIDKYGESAQVPWARNKLTKDNLAEDGDAKRPIQGNRADVKDTSNGGIRAKTNQVNPDTQAYREPDGKDRYTAQRHDLRPDSTKWHKSIPRVGEYCPCKRLHSSKIPKLEDNECTDSVKYASSFAQNVIEDLCDRLLDRRVENGIFPSDVTHDKTQDDIEQPSSHVGKKHAHRNRPWGFEFRALDLFRNMSGRVVAG